jgi:phytoene dehydrogenase-like protein
MITSRVNIRLTAYNKRKNLYDVAIIGAGIGGLVSGCYLAKSGLKVLVVEKGEKVGGYCTSFQRNGYKFDAGVHGIGGMHSNGSAYKLISDLSLSLKFEKKNPAESIFFKDKYFINFWSDSKRTLDEFITEFPDEQNPLRKFTDFILKSYSLEIFLRYRNKSFFDVLSGFFKNEDLKSILGIPLGNIGVSSETCSAQAGITFYREFLFNTHAYPVGGMQVFSDSLGNKFISYHGNLYLNTHVNKIIKNKNNYLIFSEDERVFESKMLILNIDLMQSMSIIKDMNIVHQLKKIIKPLRSSLSACFVNIGLSKRVKFSFKGQNVFNLWYFPKDDTSRIFLSNKRSKYKHYLNSNSIFISVPSPNTLRMLMLVPYKENECWKDKNKIYDNLLKRGKQILCNLDEINNVAFVSTPEDLIKYTSNYEGACYGWAAAKDLGMAFKKFLNFDDKLFFCGHWVPNIFGSGGISSVIHSGFLCSNYILKRGN